MALESTVQMQQNDGNRTPEKPVDREKVLNFFLIYSASDIYELPGL